MTDALSILTFASENEYGPERHGIQWQFPGFTINCIAVNFMFAHKIIEFIEETRANPKYRDTHLGGGVYRHMEENSIDISSSFLDLKFIFMKCGECDHGYDLSFSSKSEFRISFHLEKKELDDFIYGLKEIIEDYLE